MKKEKTFKNIDTTPAYTQREEVINFESQEDAEEIKEALEDLSEDEKKEELRPELIRRNRPRAGMCRFFTYLTPENMEYINIMSGVNGVTRQVFINELIENERKTNEIYRQALELKLQLQKGNK